MYSYIDNYEGIWEDKVGNTLVIDGVDEHHCTVTFIPDGQDTPLLRPWLKQKPATDMIGTYDPQYGSAVDIELAEKGTRFCLSIDFECTDYGYQELTPAIIRNENDSFFDQYYHLLGPLESFIKVNYVNEEQ